MKNIIFFKNIGLLLILIAFASSCSSMKKTAVACPEFPSQKAQYKIAFKKTHAKKTLAFSNKSKRIRPTSRQAKNISFHDISSNERTIVASESKLDFSSSQFVEATILNSYETTSLNQSPEVFDLTSSTLSSQSGPKINEDFLIKDNNSEPKIEIRSDTSRTTQSEVQTQTSSVEQIVHERSNRSELTTPNNTPQEIEGLGLAGFIVSLAGLIILGIPFGIVGIVFGGISLGKINKNPDKYKGKGFAIGSLVIGIIDIIGVLLLLALI